MVKKVGGFDTGYFANKATDGTVQKSILSVTSPAVGEIYTLDGASVADAIEVKGLGNFAFGKVAIQQSDFLNRREERTWYKKDMYKVLFLAMITELWDDREIDLTTTVGLPVSFYSKDKDELREILSGEYTVQRQGRHEQLINIDPDNLSIVPQAYGVLLANSLNQNGDVHQEGGKIMQSTSGVADIGGHTTNLQAVERMTQLIGQSESIDIGGWKAVKAIRRYIKQVCPDLPELADHKIADAIKNKSIDYYDDVVDLTDPVETTCRGMAQTIAARMTTLWDNGAGLQQILVAGGGAKMLGDLLKEEYPHPGMKIVNDPIFSNAIGFYRNSIRKANLKNG